MNINKKTVKRLEKEGVLTIIDEKGREINDPRPLVLHTGINKTPTLNDRIQRLLKNELSRQAQEQGMETFEEADDFDVHDDFDSPEVDTQYQLMLDEIPTDLTDSVETATEESAHHGAKGESPEPEGNNSGDLPDSDRPSREPNSDSK